MGDLERMEKNMETTLYDFGFRVEGGSPRK